MKSCFWLFLVIFGYFWLFLVIFWLFFGYFWVIFCFFFGYFLFFFGYSRMGNCTDVVFFFNSISWRNPSTKVTAASFVTTSRPCP